jgi:hypothetical protein
MENCLVILITNYPPVRGHENGLLMQLKRLGNNESLRSDSLSVHVELIVRMKCLHVRLQVVTIRAGLHNPSSIIHPG